MNEIFKCYCEKEFNKNNFKRHFRICTFFIDKFKSFDNTMTLFLKYYLKTQKDLCNFRFLLERFIKLIDDKIKINKEYEIIDDNNENEHKHNQIYQYKKRKVNILNNIYNINSSNIIEVENLINSNFSYKNSIFLSLSSLCCIKNWYNKTKHNNIINHTESSIRKEFFVILDNIYNKERLNIKPIIEKCEKNNLLLYNEKIKNDPFHFINSFLELFHYENNINIKPNENNKNANLIDENNINNINPNLNFNIVKNPTKKNLKNLNYMYLLYENIFQNTQKSIISKNFFNIMKYKINCKNCKDLYYFNIEKILTLDVDKYSYEKNNNNIDLNDLLKYTFLEEKNINCKICQKNNAKESKNFFYPSKVLILFFKRYSHDFKKIIKFSNNISIKDYVCSERINEKYFIPNYSLKVCISHYNMQSYFTYICTNNIWKRYSDSVYKILDEPEKEIREYEPQILIYELDNYNLINEIEKQKIQKILFDGINNARKEFLDYQDKISSKKMAKVEFFLIPDGIKKSFDVKLNSTFEEIINKNGLDYKLFICNTKKLEPNSKNTLQEILYIYKINKDNIIINAIKGI